MITDTIIRLIFGSQHERDIKKLLPVLHQVNSREAWAVSLTAEQFREKTAEFRSRFAAGESLDDLLPEAFALAREAHAGFWANVHTTCRCLVPSFSIPAKSLK